MKRLKTVFLLFVFLFGYKTAYNRVDKRFVNGFASKINGNDFQYHSSIPLATESLLVRATDGSSQMEWLTSPLPDNNNDTAIIIWLAGIGSSPGYAAFDVWVNDIHRFTFYADGANYWQITDKQGYILCFKKDFTDQHGDKFGFMQLKIPPAKYTPVMPVKIKIAGQAYQRTSWYMTFKFPLRSGVNLKTLPALIQEDGKTIQAARAGIIWFSSEEKAILKIDGRVVLEAPLKWGYNYLRFGVPVVEKTRKIKYVLQAGKEKWEGSLFVKPVKKWTIDFVQHTHTDIGYTRPQTDIMAEHLRYIDYALDYCDITDSLPDEARFRWTCEASWAVEEYLRSRPASQIQRLKNRIEEGRIEVTGMYFNFSDLPDEAHLAASLRPLKELQQMGIKVKTAMQNDVNGIGWCLAEYFADMGVKYLNMGTHGHRALICFDKPTLFWWESPSGKRMLAWRGEHYMTGNTIFKIHAGDFDVFEDALLTYLEKLEAKGYPYDEISIQHSGYLIDNSPPSTLACEMIRKWNSKYSWPRLRTDVASGFFERMEKANGDRFPVYKAAWPDWWTDGFGAACRETMVTRQAQGTLCAVNTGFSMAALLGARLPVGVTQRLKEAEKANLFFTEHTCGYHASVSEPFHKYSMYQRGIKESYAYETARRAEMLKEEAMGVLQQQFPRAELPSILIFNTLSYSRRGLAKVYIDHQILPRFTAFSITDAQGNKMPAQPLEHWSDGTWWLIGFDSIPALGYQRFYIHTCPEGNAKTEPLQKKAMSSYENQWYKIGFDTLRGTVRSLFDKCSGQEWIASDDSIGLGAFIYETLGNRSQMESFKLDNYQRRLPDTVWFEGFQPGELFDAFRFRASTPAAMFPGGLITEYRLYKSFPRIEIVYHLEKKLVTEPEGIYIAFPFDLKGGNLAFDVQGGEIRPGIDQIPGSANDWNTVQTYARIYGNNIQLILSSNDIPLMQFGGINTGRYTADAKPSSLYMYSWPMNNYWTTNFNAYQMGTHEWKYTLTTTADASQATAARFGVESKVPFLSRVIPGGGKDQPEDKFSLFSNWPAHVMLVNMKPLDDGGCLFMHVREIAGRKVFFEPELRTNTYSIQMVRCDANGNILPEANSLLSPYESAFFKIIVK
ncbi:MAG: hypothetical protein PWR20_2329 [Bacteroidales bacterium]|jgi:hypothetical protein|nr:hypothetical protein [Bacteroidales bacterium]MDN5330616.1 hypothetical protein [Bacteroidales bacterium]